MKIKRKRSGFILLVVLGIISLFAAEMYMLSTDCFALMFRTNDIYLDAVEKNLVLSGLAWSEENKIVNKAIQLELPADFSEESKLEVFFAQSSENKVKVNINAYCILIKQVHQVQKTFLID